MHLELETFGLRTLYYSNFTKGGPFKPGVGLSGISSSAWDDAFVESSYCEAPKRIGLTMVSILAAISSAGMRLGV